jgi:hypothetical protein
MKLGKKQMIIGAVVLLAGFLIYRNYKKPAADAAPAAPAADDETASADEEATANEAASAEGFLGRGKKKKKHLGTRKERIAKSYVSLLKKGVDPMGAHEMIAKKIKGNKTSKKEQAAAMAELADVAATPKRELVEVAEARTVGGGDGFLSQSFVM